MKFCTVVAVCLFITFSVRASEPAVTVALMEQLQFFPSRSAPASVMALNQSKLSAEIMAKVKRLKVQVGDSVVPGQLLVELDCLETELALKVQEAQVKQLQEQLAFDQRQLSRGSTLAKKKNLGEADLDRRQTAVLATEAQLLAQRASRDAAKLNVTRCHVASPYEGIVLKRLVSEGELITRGQATVEILQLAHQDISAKIPLTDISSFQQAASYHFLLNGRRFPLQLRAILPVVENFASSREVRMEFVGESALSGANGRVVWHSPVAHLPAYLLQLRGGNRGVFIVEDDKARFVEVPESQEGRPIPFSTSTMSLPQKVRIILDGRQGLVDGEKINWTLSKSDIVEKKELGKKISRKKMTNRKLVHRTELGNSSYQKKISREISAEKNNRNKEIGEGAH